MQVVYTVFDQCVEMMSELFNTCISDWSIFGTFLIFLFLIRKLAQAFNKLKG